MAELKEIRSLRSMRRMPLPHLPAVEDYGEAACGDAHDVWLFSSITRERTEYEAHAVLEEGESACFFHPNRPAVAICEVSGRMICELCVTEWEGKTVSFEALQTVLKGGAGKRRSHGHIRWDDVALALATFPLLLWFITVVTAPVALFISLWFLAEGSDECGASEPLALSRGRWALVCADRFLGLAFAWWTRGFLGWGR